MCRAVAGSPSFITFTIMISIISTTMKIIFIMMNSIISTTMMIIFIMMISTRMCRAVVGSPREDGSHISNMRLVPGLQVLFVIIIINVILIVIAIMIIKMINKT